MILTDTGPIVALFDVDDQHYPACIEFVKSMRQGNLLVPSACFTEAMYLLHRSGGYRLQADLWRARRAGLITVHESSANEYDRMASLMKTYRDIPMDQADAAVVAAAEILKMDIVFTLDSHFYAYQTNNGPLRIAPTK
ncbi:MAG: PIN domain-containing protein [Capsulimonas sp.]|uniref:type II toxin-antitoxin system VapC family toxin n=1 Tax=Capsulimonas sp. TaxID=2494211 RepID=UPI003267BF67